MPTGRRFRFGLAPKLAFCLGTTTAAVILIYASVSLHYQRLEFERTAVQDADRVGELIQRSTRYSMLHNDRAALTEAFNTIGGQPGIHVCASSQTKAPSAFPPIPARLARP